MWQRSFLKKDLGTSLRLQGSQPVMKDFRQLFLIANSKELHAPTISLHRTSAMQTKSKQNIALKVKPLCDLLR